MARSFKLCLIMEDRRGGLFFKGIIERLKVEGKLPPNLIVSGVRKSEKCNPKLGRIVTACLTPLRPHQPPPLDRVIVIVDAEGGPVEGARIKTLEHIPSRFRDKVRIVVLEYCAEEWVCAGLGISFGDDPVRALKDHLRKERGAKADYHKFMLAGFVSKLNLVRLLSCRSFREFLKALQP